MSGQIVWTGRPGVTFDDAVDEIMSALDRVLFQHDRRAMETDAIAEGVVDIDDLDAHVDAASTWQRDKARALVRTKLARVLRTGQPLEDVVIVQ